MIFKCGIWFGGLAIGVAIMGAAGIFDPRPAHWWSVIPCGIIGLVLTIQNAASRPASRP
jgi:hypothetical protein